MAKVGNGDRYLIQDLNHMGESCQTRIVKSVVQAQTRGREQQGEHIASGKNTSTRRSLAGQSRR